MKRFIVCFFVAMCITNPALAAGKKTAAGAKVDPDAPWYRYDFIDQEMIKTGAVTRYSGASACKKSEESPADIMKQRDAYGERYLIIEHAVEDGKPVLLDIVTTTVSYSPYPRAFLTTIRFFRGEDYCNSIRELDVSGKLDKARLNRYR